MAVSINKEQVQGLGSHRFLYPTQLPLPAHCPFPSLSLLLVTEGHKPILAQQMAIPGGKGGVLSGKVAGRTVAKSGGCDKALSQKLHHVVY